MVDVNQADELEIIQAAVAGDRRAFDAVVNLYAARLRWLVDLRLDYGLRARVSPEDVLQEALLVVAQQIQALTIESEAAFWTWLCKVVEQRLIDARRRHVEAAARDVRREQPLPTPNAQTTSIRLEALLKDSATSPSGKLRKAEEREALKAALDRLPPSFREVIVLRILEGLSVSDVATIMGRSPGAISVLLTKAIKRLAEVIGPDKGA